MQWNSVHVLIPFGQRLATEGTLRLDLLKRSGGWLDRKETEKTQTSTGQEIVTIEKNKACKNLNVVIVSLVTLKKQTPKLYFLYEKRILKEFNSGLNSMHSFDTAITPNLLSCICSIVPENSQLQRYCGLHLWFMNSKRSWEVAHSPSLHRPLDLQNSCPYTSQLMKRSHNSKWQVRGWKVGLWWPSSPPRPMSIAKSSLNCESGYSSRGPEICSIGKENKEESYNSIQFIHIGWYQIHMGHKVRWAI